MAVYLYINGSNRTADLQSNQTSISNQIQQRADSIDLVIMSGTKPAENQDCGFYRGDTIAAFSGTTVTLNGYFQRDTNFFYEGQKLKIRIGDSDEEEVTVLSYDEDALEIVLVAAPSGTVSVGDKIGEKMFGGVVSRVTSRNVVYKANVEYDVGAVSYDKIFDKEMISDSWADVDSRYIINDALNTTINYNQSIDAMDYADDAAVQAEWVEVGLIADPAIKSTDLVQGTSAVEFPWSGGTGGAVWDSTPISTNLADFVGVSSGVPTKGNLTFWYKRSSATGITLCQIRFGSAVGNHCIYQFPLKENTDWNFISVKLKNPVSTVGTPAWTATDYFTIRFNVTESSGSVIVDDARVTADGSFTAYNLKSSPPFDDFRSPRIKPTAFMQLLAKAWNYVWYIDYERDIHFASNTTESAPFEISDTSDNFHDLQTEVDQSQLGNRIVVLGGEEISDNRYAQVIPGDNAVREWVLKSKFSGLEVSVDDGTGSHAAEAGTTTTNIKITAHGLSSGDHVINRTRANAVREITVVDADNFTVEAVGSQTNGDNITFFSLAKTDGIEGIDDETLFDYMGNSNEKTVRASSQTVTLPVTSFIRFEYNERVPIELQYTNFASVSLLKGLGFGNGIFDLDTYSDQTIEDRGTAIAIAQAKVAEFSNPIISGTFSTEQNGLKAGQILHVSDANQGFSGDYVIQTVSIKQREGFYKDNFVYRVKFGTTLFGWIEFMQKLLSLQNRIGVNEEAIVSTFVTADEIVEVDDVNQVATDGGFKTVTIAETVTTDDVDVAVDFPSGTWRYEPNGVGQPLETRFDLCDYGP